MKQVLPCADRVSLVTFGNTNPSSISSFAGNPFYLNTTTGALFVGYGSSFQQADLTT